ncbi:ARID DNA-binding domain-containing protein [Artemisia annua]|uniref:ARID DNA-binding domain-containing protein n=1 Tax=Artemisia annua TaxID=35608 RepID=A0A2U1QKX0_ARTAN|nr:ARID DNA-binding domain-containing protein [Artemisia annua]
MGGKDPVKQWYQSHGSNSWEMPPSSGFKHGRYLLRETPKRVYQWNNRRKSISPKAKEMLVNKVLENEIFNATKKKEIQDENKVSTKGKETMVKTRKEKRARCYICKTRGHTYWMCEKSGTEKVHEKEHGKDVDNTSHKEAVKYPANVHVLVDYMVENTDHGNWNQIWYVSHSYDFHMCPTVGLFCDLQHRFKMVGVEENVRMFIFSHGIGSALVKTINGEIRIGNVQYTPEVTLNVLSYKMLEAQGFNLEISGNRCKLRNRYEDEPGYVKMESTDDLIWGPKQVIDDHNRYLDNYYASIDPSTESSLIKGLENLAWDKNGSHDYADDDYISWNGELYSLTVNSYNRFISFMNLIKKDDLVFRNWAVISRKFDDAIKWFYLVLLNYDKLEALPPRIGVFKIDLLCLHKAVANMGGYVTVTLENKWGLIARMQGLTLDDGQAIRECFRKFIDLMVVYHETAMVPWGETSDTVRESKNEMDAKDSHGQKMVAGKDGTKRDAMEQRRVKVELGESSSGTTNDFDVIV